MWGVGRRPEARADRWRQRRQRVLLLLLASEAAGQLPPKAPQPSAAVPCDRWQVLDDHNAVYARVGTGCNGGGPTQPPCRGEAQNGVGKHYYFLGVVESMADCLQAAQVPIPDSAVENQGKDGPSICQTVAYHNAEFGGSYGKHCYCGTSSEWIAPQHPEKNIDSASCQSYGTPAAGAVFSAVLIAAGAVYTVGGVAIGQRRGSGRGIQGHPHYATMVALGGLVQDGVAFVRAGRTGRRRARGTQHNRSQATKPLLDEPSGGGKASGPSFHQNNRKSSKRQNRHAKDRKHHDVDDAGSGNVGGAAPGVVAPTVKTGSRADRTPSGGGGRWVHVPN